jgi:TetR/AcrR family transcriptional regulator, transcriptional repressor for nem operon
MPKPSVRGKIIDAALELLHARGFNGCSVQDITDAAGAPKGSFFYHFKNKEILAMEVLAPYGNNSRIDMLFDERLTPLGRLRTHFEYLLGTYENFSFERGCLLGNFASEMASAHPEMRERLKSIFDQWSSAVASVLREAQATREIDSRLDADQLGQFLVNAWEGVVMRMKLVKTREPADQFFNVTFEQMLK